MRDKLQTNCIGQVANTVVNVAVRFGVRVADQAFVVVAGYLAALQNLVLRNRVFHTRFVLLAFPAFFVGMVALGSDQLLQTDALPPCLRGEQEFCLVALTCDGPGLKELVADATDVMNLPDVVVPTLLHMERMMSPV
jgi:hypothetical protein